VSIRQLYQLQTLEEGIVFKEQVLAQALSHLGESPALKHAKAKLAEARNALEAAAKEQRATEAAIADLTSKMTAARESLYSGRIKNPKELQNLQRELEIFKAQCDPLEEKDLGLMEKIEAWQASVKQRVAELAMAENVWQNEQISLLHEIEAAKQILAELRVKHEQFLPGLPPAELKLYVQTKQMRGQAVARVVQGTCGKCRLNLSSAENQRVHSGQTVPCSSCGRLLFFE
jgi:predicted  nucleic acid-binding Zn-ribbon protein